MSRVPLPALSLVATAAAAALGWAGATTAALVVLAAAALLDARPVRAAGRSARAVDALLGRPLRAALRLAVLLAAGHGLWSGPVAWAVLAPLALVVVVTAGLHAVDARVGGLFRHPSARGIAGLEAHRGTGSPPTRPMLLLGEWGAGGAAVLAPERPVVVWAVGLGTLALAGAAGLRWLRAVLRGRRDLPRRMRVAQEALDELRPAVVLYSGDGPAAVHEVAMWLSTLERLPVPALVLLRNRETLDALPATDLPVLCVPGATDVIKLRLDMVRVALFVANAGNNIHLLRVPGIRTAFIGHGDSDKSASVNPFSKVYDQVWVAGQAGRERYLRAGVGLRPDAVVEVGRPQLALVRTAAEGFPDLKAPASPPTLLYAPTWEGWGEDQNYGSVVTHGERLVRALLSQEPPVRILYRPHPFTGRRSTAAAEADARIRALLQDANAAAGLPTSVLPRAVPDRPACARRNASSTRSRQENARWPPCRRRRTSWSHRAPRPW